MSVLLRNRIKIYLVTENPKIKKKNNRLKYIKVWQFSIKAMKNIISYKINLSKNAKILFLCYMS